MRSAAAAVLLALGSPGCRQAPPRTAVPVQSEKWSFRATPGTLLQTPHYRLYSTCTDAALLTALPNVMEGALAEYRALIPADGLPAEPMPGYVFATRGQWEAFTRVYAGPRAATNLMIRSGGYEEGGTLVVYFVRRGVTLSVMVHEGLHQYLTAIGRRGIPAWLNEGLACYFEAFDLDDAGRPTFTPRHNVQRLRSLREAVKGNLLIPLQRLMTMDAGLAVQKGEQATRVFYGQVWAMVLFLLDPARDNPYRAGFRRLLSELGAEQMRMAGGAYRATETDARGGGLSLEEAIFRHYVTEDLDAFEREFVAFAQALARA